MLEVVPRRGTRPSSRTSDPRQKPKPRLQLIELRPSRQALPSLAITSESSTGQGRCAPIGEAEPARRPMRRRGRARSEVPLDRELWEVVRDDRDGVVQPIPAGARNRGRGDQGQEIVFRTTVDEPGVVVTKTYRLWQGSRRLRGRAQVREPRQGAGRAYKLLGPHGIPIEGEWYTGTFRDVFFGQIDGQRRSTSSRSSADDIAKQGEPTTITDAPACGSPGSRTSTSPSSSSPSRSRPSARKIAGTARRLPRRSSTDPTDRRRPTWRRDHVEADQGRAERAGQHTYKVFAGPKTAEALTPYGAEELASYRKNQWIGIPVRARDGRVRDHAAARHDLPAYRSGSRGSSAARRATTASRSSC